MRKLLLAASALALASPVAAIAAPVVTVGFGSSTSLSPFNNFIPQLTGLGYTKYSTTGSTLVLSGMAKITYYFMGSESGFSDTFKAGSLSYTETSSFENHFGSPILIGTQTFAAGGSLAGILNFSATNASFPAGAPATVGQDGFGVFLKTAQATGTGVTEFFFGYDDQTGRADDNHDDFIVKAVVTAVPVPEPGTWAMLLSGFAIVGSLLRRRRSNGVTILA